jgi:PadR family transcriptional regulator PadR
MKFESQLLKGIAPVVVLETLSRGPMYGYELSQTIEQRSGDILTLGKGTLYPLLYNLEAKNLVKGYWEQTQSGRKRRYYSITSKGKEELARQKEQLRDLATGLKFVFGETGQLVIDSTTGGSSILTI